MKNCPYNMTALAIVTLLAMAAPALAYTIDGDCSDWNISPQNDSSHRLIGISLIPDPVGTIDYVIDNDNAEWAAGAIRPNMSNFTGPEWCDIEAMYADDNSTHIFVLIITSMPKHGMTWPNPSSAHYQPGDLALCFDGSSGTEYGVKIVQNDGDGAGARFGVVGTIYSNPTWAVRDPGPKRTEIVSVVSGTPVGNATIKYTGTIVGEIPGVDVPDGPVDSGLPWDTFGHIPFSGGNPPIPNEVVEIAIPKSALNLQNTTLNLQSSPSCGNGVIKLESVTLTSETPIPITPIPEFVTLAIPVISLMGLVFYMRRSKNT
ncbi:MAG: hypothetical protein U9N12_00560 [Euryarchaeota archaeon]|nr:hypothetical protein [Euryarchaeota archaeon]